jgi:hypothetical protein
MAREKDNDSRKNVRVGDKKGGGGMLRRWAPPGNVPEAPPRPGWAMAALYLLPLGLIFDLGGCLPPHLRRFLIFALLLLPGLLRPGRRLAGVALAVLAVLAGEAFFAPPPMARIALWLLLHQAVWHWVGPPPLRVTAGVAGYGLLHLWLFLTPTGYSAVEALTAVIGRVAGWLTGNAYHLGPTYQGLGGLLLFLCLSVAAWDRSRLALGRTLSFLGVVLLLNGVMSLVLVRKVDFGADMVWTLKYQEPFTCAALWRHVRGLLVLVYPALIFLAQMAAYLALHYESARRGTNVSAPETPGWLGFRLRGRAWPAGFAAAGVALLFLAAPPTTWRRPKPAKLICVEKGVVSYSKPDYTRYGRAAGGMFGLLPEYARLFGCAAEVVKDIPEQLDTDSILLLTNVDWPLTAEERRRVWDFVRAGGRLWVLGDHTFIKNGRNHINDLLAPCHIALHHDSAQFFPQGWFNSYDFRQGTPFGGLRDPAENRPAILVGASLKVSAPATPFILGRYGYGDWGTTAADDQRGYIGDFKYQAQERLGDLVLVAGEPVGRGKVLVFGDTTSFFCNNMPRSYEILRAGLSWLGEAPGWSASASAGGRWGLGLGLAGLVMGLWLSATPGWWAAVLGALAVLSAVGHRPAGLLPFAPEYSRERLAVVDFSHQPDASKHGSMDNALHGLTINLMRYGLLPVALDTWDRKLLDVARLVVLDAPRRVINARERRDLDAFFARGGTVWLACGFPHFAFCRDFLAPLNIKVRGLPLGRFFDRPVFGHPVSFFSAWPLEIANPRVAVICHYDQWPLIAVLPIQQGRLAVVGDSQIFQNRNVEGFENYDPASIQLIRSLLDYTVGPPGS